MKNIVKIVVLGAVLSLASCKENKAENKSTDAIENNSETLYSCPMHTEIQGHKGESCSICGMELTMEVK